MKHKARKRFGQNFLIDEGVINRIISSIAAAEGQLVFEIGPGREALTGPLSQSGASLKLVELDRDLASMLTSRGYDVISADALKVDFAELADGQPYRLVGNLPYNISTPLMFHLLAQSSPPLDMHFMLQKEVVDRMVAGPGSKAYGRLTLMCQNLAEVVPLFNVPARAFSPAPKVESAVVRLIPRPQPLVAAELEKHFAKVVSQAFSMRRKTIRNGLRQLMTAEQIESVGINPGARAEQLSISDFEKLARLLNN